VRYSFLVLFSFYFINKFSKIEEGYSFLHPPAPPHTVVILSKYGAKDVFLQKIIIWAVNC
jgi:hypothetical protein